MLETADEVLEDAATVTVELEVGTWKLLAADDTELDVMAKLLEDTCGARYELLLATGMARDEEVLELVVMACDELDAIVAVAEDGTVELASLRELADLMDELGTVTCYEY